MPFAVKCHRAVTPQGLFSFFSGGTMRHLVVGKRRNESLLILATTLGITLLAPALHAANYLIDANYTGVSGAAGNGYTAQYSDIATALAAIPAGASASNPNRIYFAPGTYNTASTTGVSLSDSRSNLALIGLSGNPDDVVITSTLDSLYAPAGGSALGTTGSATLQLKGNNVSASAITFGNSTDTPYIANIGKIAVTPQGSYTASGIAQTANQPAVALLLQGDQQAFSNCKFLGYQDTLYTKGGRTYFTNCTVSGDVDFIFANGTDVFNNSTINMDGDHSGGDITAASTDKRTSNGLVFLNSTITANSVHGNPVIDSQNAASITGPAASSMSLGRPWGWTQTGGDASTVFLNTKMSNAIKPAGWLAWNSNETISGNAKNNGDPSEDSRYAEFNSMDSSGNPLDVSQRVSWSHQLTATEAAAYTVDNIFSTEAGYAWYGLGYAGSADPTSPNFSWAAYWGNRNANNDTANDLVPGNPTAYSDPSWTVAGNWDPDTQLAAQIVPAPEPASIVLLGAGAMTGLRRRRRNAK
jgi:pectinesterase